MPKKKIINAHAHVFTSQFVPPFLARTIIIWPLFYFINTRHIVALAKRYYSWKHGLKFPKKNDKSSWDKIYARRRCKRFWSIFGFNFRSIKPIYYPYKAIVLWLSVVALIYTITILASLFGLDEKTSAVIKWIKEKMAVCYLYFEINIWLKLLWIAFVVIFINWSRRAIWFVVKGLFPIFNKIVNAQGMELLERYLLMGRFAMYGSQRKVAERALHQLPPGSDMVILPMDMEEMGAGKTRLRSDLLENKAEKLKDGWTAFDFQDTYKYQMRELWDFVESRRRNPDNEGQYHPFLFLDPRRIAKEGKAFFDYEIKNGKMVLNPCFVKTYMEDRKFSGFKIYPALGYYPFDEHLLPLWRYASENNIPIMSHCVMGVIYYRGKKKKAWNFHPVFKQYYDNRNHHDPIPMLLPQQKNVDFQFNFTHPMNYLCLYEERFLKDVLATASKDIQDLFGYQKDKTSLSHNLSNLKICMAHYGGEDQWTKYLETDRDVYARSIITNPDVGIDFMRNSDDEFSWDKINSLWHDTDWYSIITSLLMRYDNIYADLSYIISKPSIYPLLNKTLQKGNNYDTEMQAYNNEPSPNRKASHLSGRNRLRSHVLYGTDFYVVRNHNSDKDLFIETQAALDEERFDLIARENTSNYLSRL